MLPKIIAHRGASAAYPENTLAAFRAASAAGAGWIEFDVMLAKDGVPVVIHDETVDRTTNGKARVDELTVKELQKLDAGQGEKIPTLKETLALLDSLGLYANVELKPSRRDDFELARRTASATFESVKEHKVEEKILFSSFDWQALEFLQKFAPEISRGVLVGNRQMALPWLETAKKLNTVSIHFPIRSINEELIQKVHRAGFKILTWTINDPQQAAELFRLGIDGVFTDAPEMIRQAFQEH